MGQTAESTSGINGHGDPVCDFFSKVRPIDQQKYRFPYIANRPPFFNLFWLEIHGPVDRAY
jgi:hypothetical protein